MRLVIIVWNLGTEPQTPKSPATEITSYRPSDTNNGRLSNFSSLVISLVTSLIAIVALVGLFAAATGLAMVHFHFKSRERKEYMTDKSKFEVFQASGGIMQHSKPLNVVSGGNSSVGGEVILDEGTSMSMSM